MSPCWGSLMSAKRIANSGQPRRLDSASPSAPAASPLLPVLRLVFLRAQLPIASRAVSGSKPRRTRNVPIRCRAADQLAPVVPAGAARARCGRARSSVAAGRSAVAARAAAISSAPQCLEQRSIPAARHAAAAPPPAGAGRGGVAVTLLEPPARRTRGRRPAQLTQSGQRPLDHLVGGSRPAQPTGHLPFRPRTGPEEVGGNAPAPVASGGCRGSRPRRRRSATRATRLR